MTDNPERYTWSPADPPAMHDEGHDGRPVEWFLHDGGRNVGRVILADDRYFAGCACHGVELSSLHGYPTLEDAQAILLEHLAEIEHVGDPVEVPKPEPWFTLYGELEGAHYHCRLFAGPGFGKRGRIGTLTMDEDDWAKWQQLAEVSDLVNVTDETDVNRGTPSEQEEPPDLLHGFKRWEGEELGENWEHEPGFEGKRLAPNPHLHIAGAWCMSSARQEASGALIPAVYLRQVAGVVGTGPAYHVLDGIVDADVAEQWAEALFGAAKASRKDVEVHASGEGGKKG